jgi:hypothetical protein
MPCVSRSGMSFLGRMRSPEKAVEHLKLKLTSASAVGVKIGLSGVTKKQSQRQGRASRVDARRRSPGFINIYHLAA